MEQYINEIYELLLPVIPAQTTRLVLQGNVTETTHALVYYAKTENEAVYHQCYELALSETPLIDLEMLRRSFRLIAELIRKSKNEDFQQQERSNSFTIIFENGRFEISYEYPSDDGNEQADEWKKKYLI